LKFTNSASSSVVGATVRHAANHRPVGVAAINVSHSDSGLVGVYVATDGQYADPIVRAAFDGLKKVASGVDQDVFEAAKKSAQLEILLQYGQPNELALNQAGHVATHGAVLLPSEFSKQLSQVSAEDVKKVSVISLFIFILYFQAAQKIVSKPSLAAFGRINQVPYADQL
jgi:hypothetical protein